MVPLPCVPTLSVSQGGASAPRLEPGLGSGLCRFRPPVQYQQQAAKENRRTQTAEIIARLEETFGPSPIDVSSDDLTTEERVELFRRQADAAAAAYHQVVRRLAQAEHILYQEIQMKER